MRHADIRGAGHAQDPAKIEVDIADVIEDEQVISAYHHPVIGRVTNAAPACSSRSVVGNGVISI